MRSVVIPVIVALLGIGFAATVLAVTPAQTDDFETFPEPEPGEVPQPGPPELDEPPEPTEDLFPLPEPTDDVEAYLRLLDPRPPLAITRLAMTEGEICGLTQGGWLACWSLFDDERVVFPEGIFAQITAGSDHFCAIDAWGEPRCWGAGDRGQLDVPPQQFLMLAAGAAHGCGLDLVGEPVCWGDLDQAHLDPPEGPFQIIEAGGNRTCTGSAAEAPVCWGTPPEPTRPFTEPLYDLDMSSSIICGLDATRLPRCAFTEDTAPFDPPDELAVSVSAGGNFICVLDTLGDVHCTGPGAPALPAQPLIARAIASNEIMVCAVTTLNNILCWDLNGEVFRS